jgi:hypothetical protein
MFACPRRKGAWELYINLTIQNESLLLKQLHKFYNKVNIPWVQLVWYHYYTSCKLPYPGDLQGDHFGGGMFLSYKFSSKD